ncbi:sugar phosphate isomerase/epimerase family protein [Adhaeribacter aquaticus]|uniref:sugar phosphate isomerase/epimerase family protein n=1 Tax=Adhaeribacter aquaticus TaxID=299567 RepID=UPI000412BFBD|nr:sugar phosphate isomerase/epimerase family protein [Adhaeribacter aquaticus]
MKKRLSWLLLLFIWLISLNVYAQRLPKLGMVSSIDQDSLLYASGFRLIGESVSKMLSPNLSEAQFQENLKQLKQTKCKVYVCNILFPGSMKITGPDVNEQRILPYVDSVFSRAHQADIPVIVLGSSGSRRIPKGYDNEKAKADFVNLCRKMAEVAKKHKITIAIENLNKGETNFLNTLAEVTEVVTKVNHPNFRVNADIYHMLKENESPLQIQDAGKLIVHVEIAEREIRSMPGVMGDDFRPYLKALKTIKYKGPIIIEAKVTDPVKEIPLSYQYLINQLQEVF